MQPVERLDCPIFAHGSPKPLNQFIAVGLHPLGLAFCLPVDHHIHPSLFSCFFFAHLEDLQNQTIIFGNYSTTLCSKVSIIIIR
jgi:hypothetical protein